MKIPLFDLDWTLLAKDKKRNIHDEAFYYAFEKIYNIGSPQKVSKEGWIDNQVIAESMRHSGISEQEVNERLPQATKAMTEYFIAHINEGQYPLLPGVQELLSTLKARKVIVGLLTGNVETIAWGKLEKAGIRDFFQFGAFGDQAHKRVDLIKIAHEQVEALLHKKIAVNDLVIIGDTPLDVECAKEGGVKSIAVASGPHTLNELSRTGADLVIASLMEKKKVLNFLKQ